MDDSNDDSVIFEGENLYRFIMFSRFNKIVQHAWFYYPWIQCKYHQIRGTSMTDIDGSGKGSLIMGMLWMFILSILLFWLPAFGPLIAGIVGGKVAGGAVAGLMAALIPGIILAIALFFAGTVVTTLPLVGAILAGSVLLLYLVYIPPLLIGALIGGLLA